jgi:dipeptidase E
LAFAKIDIAVKGLHEYEDVNEALKCGIFTGGEIRSLLVTQLYKK